MKLEFLMCGNHTDAFLSQAAIYRLMLDSFGGDHAAARLVLCVGGEARTDIAPRWRQAFSRIDLQWIDGEDYRLRGDLAQSDLVYEALDPTADISVVCDADTLLLRPLPASFLAEMKAFPTLAGCIAHYPPPLIDFRTQASQAVESHEALWKLLGHRLLGYALSMPYRYTLLDPSDMQGACPFYINLGFFVGAPDLLAAFHREHKAVVPIVREVLDNDFYEQLSVPFSVARVGIPVRTLPMRFNFPNDPISDAMYPIELEAIVNIHYLRTKHFDRHRIFAEPDQFARFMEMPLDGSNAVFREAIRKLTGGRYPFSQ